jgi:hypothetical protein
MFQLVVAESQLQNCYVWHAAGSMLLIVTEDGKKDIKQFIREQREAREAVEVSHPTTMATEEDEQDVYEDFGL